MAPACSKLSPTIKLKLVTLGREANKTSINIADCPESSCKPTIKAQAFNTTKNAIARYIDSYDYAELSTCLVANIPGHHSFTTDQVLTLERTLLDQPFIKDGDKTIQNLLDDLSKATGDTVTVARFSRYAVGEEAN